MPESGASTDAGTPSRYRQVGVLVLAALGILFSVVNFDKVGVNWLIGTWQTPLIVVIAVSILVGASIGFSIGRRRRTA